MADQTGIEWTDATWQPITGCTIVSPGCINCYAMKLAGGRLQHHPSRVGLTQPSNRGPVWNGQVRMNWHWLKQPIQWTRPRMIFVCAHGDLFHESVPDDWIDQVFGVMWACLYTRNEQPGHVFQVLTKRAERMREYLSTDRREKWARAAVNHGGGIDPDGLYDQTIYHPGPHPRIWLGVSVEDQQRAEQRIPELLTTPAAVHWISAEPLLSAINIRRIHLGDLLWLDATTGAVDVFHDGGMPSPFSFAALRWVVCGGESGPRARPMHPGWARLLRDQCAAAAVPFMHKQNGELAPQSAIANDGSPFDQTYLNNAQSHIFEGGERVYRVGKKRAGRLLDGIEHNAFPAVSHA